MKLVEGIRRAIKRNQLRFYLIKSLLNEVHAHRIRSHDKKAQGALDKIRERGKMLRRGLRRHRG